MKLESVETHTLDVDRLRRGWVLDAGCRDFLFSRAMINLGCRVVALDPDPSVTLDEGGPTFDRRPFDLWFFRVGLSTADGEDDLVLMENPEMRHLSAASGFSQWRDAQRIRTETITISSLMRELDVYFWECVKLDVEGAEYEILRKWPGPIARQITVEFHDHMEKRPPELYTEIREHLGQWYDVAKWDLGDTLLVLREPL